MDEKANEAIDVFGAAVAIQTAAVRCDTSSRTPYSVPRTNAFLSHVMLVVGKPISRVALFRRRSTKDQEISGLRDTSVLL